MTELNCFGTGNICIVLWCAFKWSNWPETPANSTNFILRNDFPASSHSRPILLNPDICPFDWSSPRLSVSSACFRSSMLFSPIISLSSPHLLLPTPFFSLPAFSCSSTSPFLHKPILQSVLSFTLSFPVSPFIPPPFFFLWTFLYQSPSFRLPLNAVQMSFPSLSSTIYLHLCLHLWCAHSGWRRPTQSSQGAEGLSTPTQALRHGTQRNRDRGERTDGRRTHWLLVL